MKHKILYLFLLFTIPLLGQKVEDAQQYFNNHQYEEARAIYAQLLKKNSKDALNNYRYARCCFEMQDYPEAIRYFQKTKKGYLQRDYYMAEAYFTMYQFEEAIPFYEAYLDKLKTTDPDYSRIETKMTQAENAERMLSRIEDIAIIDSTVVDKNNFLRYYNHSAELGTLKQQKLQIDSTLTVDKITYTTQREDRIIQSEWVDGRMDILTSFRLLDEWSPAAPLSDNINTETNENYPFLLLDGVTLYFAADGEHSIGGYDLFITKYIPANDAYLTPENIGMPFNSPYNDYMLVIDEANRKGWFATDRYQPEGKVAIYTFVPNDSKIIIRSDDKEYLRQAAQLKTFRQADPEELEPDNQTIEIIPVSPVYEFEFIIKDNLVYTSLGQFKSQEAKKAFEALRGHAEKLKNMQEQLAALRQQYNNAKDDAQRAIVTPKILLLEESIHAQQTLIETQTLHVRNEEIKFLMKGK